LATQPAGAGPTEPELLLGRLLDSALVGTQHQPEAAPPVDDRWEKWTTFSQRGDESYVTLAGGAAATLFCQAEVWAVTSEHL